MRARAPAQSSAPKDRGQAQAGAWQVRSVPRRPGFRGLGTRREGAVQKVPPPSSPEGAGGERPFETSAAGKPPCPKCAFRRPSSAPGRLAARPLWPSWIGRPGNWGERERGYKTSARTGPPRAPVFFSSPAEGSRRTRRSTRSRGQVSGPRSAATPTHGHPCDGPGVQLLGQAVGPPAKGAEPVEITTSVSTKMHTLP